MATLLRLALALVLACALAGPAPASAARSTPAHGRAPLTLARSVARRFWGASPCGGRVAIRTRRSLVAGLDADSDAWVTFATPSGADDLSAPAAAYTDCTISLTTARWPSPISMRQDWDMLCMTMVHEYGHLLGHAHDLRPHSIMAPLFTDYSSEPRACRDTEVGS